MPPILEKLEQDPEDMPPSYHRLNKFTKVFQKLVDAYGFNTYKELNSAPFLVITFPFLFSVMFGDFGHGTIMVLFAGFLIFFENNFNQNVHDEIGRIFFKGRFLIFLMGLFSIHSGILYNDIFSKSIIVYKSSWIVEKTKHNSSYYSQKAFIDLDPEVEYNYYPYPYGVDPIWCVSKDDIAFKNSLKMKMSIIFGVLQMSFGLFLGIFNICFTKKYGEIFTTLIPQFLFLSSLFVYLCILIFMKWIEFGPFKGPRRNSCCAPEILHIFLSIVMFLRLETDENCDAEMYPHQRKLQHILSVLAFICIPWLFLLHPIYEVWKGKRRIRKEYLANQRQNCPPACDARIKGCCQLNEPHDHHHEYHHHDHGHHDHVHYEPISTYNETESKHSIVVGVYVEGEVKSQNRLGEEIKNDLAESIPSQATTDQFTSDGVSTPGIANFDQNTGISKAKLIESDNARKDVTDQTNQKFLESKENTDNTSILESDQMYSKLTRMEFSDSTTKERNSDENHLRNDNTDDALSDRGSFKSDKNTRRGNKDSKRSSILSENSNKQYCLDSIVNDYVIDIKPARQSVFRKSDLTVCSLREQRCSILVNPKECSREIEYLEIFIHQAIHAIEFLLGSVSNTASYLRLWALSLAHSELSEVVWNQVLRLALTSTVQNTVLRVIMLYLLFAAWALLTVAILVLMEGLSAFLHTLRLH